MGDNYGIELLFRCKMEGQADIDRLAGSVGSVSAAAASATTDVSTLERAISALTGAVAENTAQLESMAGGLNNAAEGTNRLAGGARAVTNELRVMEGAMPIRAAAQLVAQMEGLNALMQAAFPIFGAIALVGVLDQILEKTGLMPDAWEKVSAAQQASYDSLDKQGRKYDELLGKLRQVQRIEFERSHGKQAGEVYAAGEHIGDVALDQETIERLQGQISVLRRLANPYANGQAYVPNQHDADVANLTGLGTSGLWGLKSTQVESGVFNDATAKQAQLLLPELEARLRNAHVQTSIDMGEAGGGYNTAATDSARTAKTASERVQAHLTRVSEDMRRAAESIERSIGNGHDYGGISGSGAFGRDLDAGIARAQSNTADELRKDGTDPASIARIKDAGDWVVGALIQAATRRATKLAAEAAGMTPPNIHEKFVQPDESFFKDNPLFVTPLLTGLPSAAEQMRDVKDRERRDYSQLGVRNQLSGGSPQDLIKQEYDTRMKYAEEEYQADLRSAAVKSGLVSAQDALDKKQEASYDARMKQEQSLLELQAKQMEQARALGESLFDAIHGHSTTQFGKDFAIGQARTLFGNVAQYPLQHISSALGGITGGANPGGIFTGTVLDPAHHSGASDAQTTAKQTTRTADEVHALRGDIRAMGGISQPPGDATGGGGSDISVLSADTIGSLGISSSPWSAAAAASALAGGTGVSSSALAALKAFGGGVAGGPTAAISALFGNTPPGTVGYGADGSPHDQYGNVITQSVGTQIGQGVSIAGAVAAGTMSAIKDFSRGGASNDLQGAGSILGMAAMIPGPQQPFVAAAAAITSLVGSLMTSGPAQRTQQITDDLVKNQYLAPTALNVTQGMDGTYESIDARGNLRTSNMSAVPLVAEPYITKRVINGQQGWYDAPGVVQQPFSGSAGGNGQTPISNAPQGPQSITINAMDSESFSEWARKPKNSAVIGEATADHLERHDGRLANAVRFLGSN